MNLKTPSREPRHLNKSGTEWIHHAIAGLVVSGKALPMLTLSLIIFCAGMFTDDRAYAAQPSGKAGADFSGIWVILPERPRNFDPDLGIGVMENPPLKPEWLEEWHKTQQRKRAGMKIWDPTGQCLPPGMPRMMNGSYPMEVLMTPGRVTVLAELYNETRRIWTDGRSHPPADELEYTFVGDSIGHWQGDILLVDTVGVREESVLDVAAVPHSDQIHIKERVHLANKNQLDWTITVEDPIVFAQPWTVTKHYVRAPAGEGIREYICAENNRQDVFKATPEDDKYDRPDARLKTRE